MMASMRSRSKRSQSDWTDVSESDPGVVLAELLGYVADMLSYFQDQVAAENRKRNVRRMLAALGVVALVHSKRGHCEDRLARHDPI